MTTALEWLNPSIKAWEIAWMAPQVIGYRVARMMTGGWPPSVRDRREYSRMGREKSEAFGHTLTAIVAAEPTASAGATLNKALAPVHRQVKANHRRLSNG